MFCLACPARLNAPMIFCATAFPFGVREKVSYVEYEVFPVPLATSPSAASCCTMSFAVSLPLDSLGRKLRANRICLSAPSALSGAIQVGALPSVASAARLVIEVLPPPNARRSARRTGAASALISRRRALPPPFLTPSTTRRQLSHVPHTRPLRVFSLSGHTDQVIGGLSPKWARILARLHTSRDLENRSRASVLSFWVFLVAASSLPT